ncbi:MAG: hypothetical protein UZ17_ACD001001661 [Acidobacteria bacterium OLB17]|nr:MAG: hypothetical protein UZ17_ACD001001661 [Acidobacteria bacterium OLB17]MCZ2390745.1 hypothetical protein [Acidobacteriota bacterium]
MDITNNYSLDDLLDFLDHTGKKGLMPIATSRALAVAARNVFGVLDAEEQKDIGQIDLKAVIRRFNNKRAKDFTPGSLKVYASRVQRAIELYEQWKENPADFSVKTRATAARNRSNKVAPNNVETDVTSTSSVTPSVTQTTPSRPGTYESSFPVGAGRVITLSNIPEDLTSAEAEKLAQFVRMLAVE